MSAPRLLHSLGGASIVHSEKRGVSRWMQSSSSWPDTLGCVLASWNNQVGRLSSPESRPARAQNNEMCCEVDVCSTWMEDWRFEPHFGQIMILEFKLIFESDYGALVDRFEVAFWGRDGLGRRSLERGLLPVHACLLLLTCLCRRVRSFVVVYFCAGRWEKKKANSIVQKSVICIFNILEMCHRYQDRHLKDYTEELSPSLSMLRIVQGRTHEIKAAPKDSNARQGKKECLNG